MSQLRSGWGAHGGLLAMHWGLTCTLWLELCALISSSIATVTFTVSSSPLETTEQLHRHFVDDLKNVGHLRRGEKTDGHAKRSLDNFDQLKHSYPTTQTSYKRYVYLCVCMCMCGHVCVWYVSNCNSIINMSWTSMTGGTSLKSEFTFNKSPVRSLGHLRMSSGFDITL